MSQFIINNSRKISLVILLLAVSFVIFRAGNSITTLATYEEGVEETVQRTNEAVDFVRQEREQCYQELENTEAGLEACDFSLEKAELGVSVCNTARKDAEEGRNVCEAEKESAETQLQQEQENYKQVVKNTVRAICCSFNDVQQGTTREWGLEENKIVCSGSFTVNCGSGETGGF